MQYIDLGLAIFLAYLFFRKEKFFVTPEQLKQARLDIEKEFNQKYATISSLNFLHGEIKDVKDTTMKIYEYLLNQK